MNGLLMLAGLLRATFYILPGLAVLAFFNRKNRPAMSDGFLFFLIGGIICFSARALYGGFMGLAISRYYLLIVLFLLIPAPLGVDFLGDFLSSRFKQFWTRYRLSRYFFYAVIAFGCAGQLCKAYRSDQQQHIFDFAEYIGGHSRPDSVIVDTTGGGKWIQFRLGNSCRLQETRVENEAYLDWLQLLEAVRQETLFTKGDVWLLLREKEKGTLEKALSRHFGFFPFDFCMERDVRKWKYRLFRFNGKTGDSVRRNFPSAVSAEESKQYAVDPARQKFTLNLNDFSVFREFPASDFIQLVRGGTDAASLSGRMVSLNLSAARWKLRFRILNSLAWPYAEAVLQGERDPSGRTLRVSLSVSGRLSQVPAEYSMELLLPEVLVAGASPVKWTAADFVIAPLETPLLCSFEKEDKQSSKEVTFSPGQPPEDLQLACRLSFYGTETRQRVRLRSGHAGRNSRNRSWNILFVNIFYPSDRMVGELKSELKKHGVSANMELAEWKGASLLSLPKYRKKLEAALSDGRIDTVILNLGQCDVFWHLQYWEMPRAWNQERLHLESFLRYLHQTFPQVRFGLVLPLPPPPGESALQLGTSSLNWFERRRGYRNLKEALTETLAEGAPHSNIGIVDISTQGVDREDYVTHSRQTGVPYVSPVELSEQGWRKWREALTDWLLSENESHNSLVKND